MTTAEWGFWMTAGNVKIPTSGKAGQKWGTRSKLFLFVAVASLKGRSSTLLVGSGGLLGSCEFFNH